LNALAHANLLPASARASLQRETLNDLFKCPPQDRLALRHELFALLTRETNRQEVEGHMYHVTDAALHLPFVVGDYSDFYAGIRHAINIGKMLRPDNPLLENYKQLPIGYHGRSSSVRESGTAVVRPVGQIKPKSANSPEFAPCARLDYELELGAWVCGSNDLGTSVPIGGAWNRIGGFCLLNDWSARDLQVWEYQPLGPFLAKSFLTTVSPWVVTSEALAPFHVAPAPRSTGDPSPLIYLLDAADQAAGALFIELEATLSSAVMRSAGLPPFRLSLVRSCEAMYWTFAQMVTHHASNGCNLRAGDLLGSGTLSGETPDSLGSLMELTGGGSSPIRLPSGESRAFLLDGDEVTFSARASREGFRSIGFGICTGTVVPARCL
jgi:fumarylacetoacetase